MRLIAVLCTIAIGAGWLMQSADASDPAYEFVKASRIPTCNQANLGQIRHANGDYNSGNSKLCVCRGKGFGDAGPRTAPDSGVDAGFEGPFNWCSLSVNSGSTIVCTGGTETVCP